MVKIIENLYCQQTVDLGKKRLEIFLTVMGENVPGNNNALLLRFITIQGTRGMSFNIKTFTSLSFKDLFIRKAIDFFSQLLDVVHLKLVPIIL